MKRLKELLKKISDAGPSGRQVQKRFGRLPKDYGKSSWVKRATGPKSKVIKSK